MADFIEKVKHGIDKSVNVASVKTREFRDMSRLKNQLSGLHEQIQTAYTNLGEFTYDLYRVKDLDQKKLTEKCQELKLLMEQLKQKELEIKETKVRTLEAMGKKLCPNCELVLPSDAKFCMTCGYKMTEIFNLENEDDVVLIPINNESSKEK